MIIKKTSIQHIWVFRFMIKINIISRAKVLLKALLQIYLRTAGVALAHQHFLTLSHPAKNINWQGSHYAFALIGCFN